MISDIEEILKALVQFRDERDWEQFHDSKNLATAISIEAAELNELYLWKSVEDCESIDKEELGEEIADILAYAFMLADRNNLNIKEIMLDKIAKNAVKYPVERCQGSARKYTELK